MKSRKSGRDADLRDGRKIAEEGSIEGERSARLGVLPKMKKGEKGKRTRGNG